MQSTSRVSSKYPAHRYVTCLSVSVADHVPSLAQLVSQALPHQGINIFAAVICVGAYARLPSTVEGYQYCHPSCLTDQKKARIDRGTNVVKVPVKVILLYTTS